MKERKGMKTFKRLQMEQKEDKFCLQPQWVRLGNILKTSGIIWSRLRWLSTLHSSDKCDLDLMGVSERNF